MSKGKSHISSKKSNRCDFLFKFVNRNQPGLSMKWETQCAHRSVRTSAPPCTGIFAFLHFALLRRHFCIFAFLHVALLHRNFCICAFLHFTLLRRHFCIFAFLHFALLHRNFCIFCILYCCSGIFAHDHLPRNDFFRNKAAFFLCQN